MSERLIDAAQQLVDGFLFGSTYALIALGVTLVFGVLHKLNLAFGVTAVAGAYCGAFLAQRFEEPSFALVLAAAAVGAGLLSVFVQLTCFQLMPLKHPLAPLMATVGMLFFLEEGIVQLTDAAPLPFPSAFADAELTLGPLFIRGDLLFVFGVCTASMLGLGFLIYRTRLGMATRAVSQQPIAAQLAGIRLSWVNNATFAIAGVLGGIGGTMSAAAVGTLSPLLIMPITVKGLIAAVVGGLSSLRGAVVAGLMIGVLENLALTVMGVTYRDMLVLALLFVFLVLRPRGLFQAAVAARS